LDTRIYGKAAAAELRLRIERCCGWYEWISNVGRKDFERAATGGRVLTLFTAVRLSAFDAVDGSSTGT
jgi:hypothetical protein